jgi:hypothetical protein
MPRGVIGDSMDRATDKMDKAISRGKGSAQKNMSILDQLKRSYPDTWQDIIKAERKKLSK